MRIASIIATLVSAAGLAFLLLRESLIADSPLGIAIQIAGICLMAWARLAFGSRSFHFAANTTRGPLVTSGPYGVIRHPIYTSILMVTFAGVLSHWSSVNGLIGMIVVLGTLVRVFIEERTLRSAYPEYADYAQKTWRMIPFVI